jgi:hypothetical protein
MSTFSEQDNALRVTLRTNHKKNDSNAISLETTTYLIEY